MTPSHYPLLLLVTNSHHALWYSAESNHLDKLNECQEEKQHYSDDEGFFHSGGPDKGDAAWKDEVHHHLKEVAKSTRTLWEQGSYQRLILIAPKELHQPILNAFEHGHFHIPVLYHEGNHTHDNEKKLLGLVKETV